MGGAGGAHCAGASKLGGGGATGKLRRLAQGGAKLGEAGSGGAPQRRQAEKGGVRGSPPLRR